MRALLPLLLLAGCYQTDILLRPPAGPVSPSPQVDDAFHMNLIDLIEISPPIDVQWACSGGPVAIHEELSFVGGIVDAVLGTVIPILSVWNPTVLCGGGGGPMPPMGGGMPPPPPPPPPQ